MKILDPPEEATKTMYQPSERTRQKKCSSACIREPKSKPYTVIVVIETKQKAKSI